MSFKMKFFKSLSVTLVLGCASLSAQRPQAVKTNILTFAPGGMPEDFTAFYQTGEEIYSFRASSSSLGIPVRYEGPQTFALFKSEADFAPRKKGDKPPEPLATLQLPAGADNVLILAIGEEDGDRIRLVGYDISSTSLKEGDYRIFNFSTQPLLMQLGDQKIGIKPGEDLMVKDSKWQKEVMALPLQIAVSEEGKAKVVYSAYWEHYPQRRSLMFLFNGRHPSTPIVFSSFNALEGPKEE